MLSASCLKKKKKKIPHDGTPLHMSHAFGLRNDITRPVEKAEEETKTPAVPTAISGFDRDKLPEKKPGAFNTKPYRRHKVPVVCLGLFNQTVSKMSLFGKIFGSNSKGGKAATPQEAIQKLRETEEMLAKKQDFLEKKIEQELITAKKNGTKNKRGRFSVTWGVNGQTKSFVSLLAAGQLGSRYCLSVGS